MTSKKHFAFVIGTRPEAIKLAPVIRECQKHPDCEVTVVSTGQHDSLLVQMFEYFKLRPDFDLAVMGPENSVTDVVAKSLSKLAPLLREISPDVTVVQGDTSSTLAGAMAAYFEGIPVAHVEAGLRTGDLKQPFPEEGNRRLVAQISDYHFASTALAKASLLAENIDSEKILVTGNTAVDSIFAVLAGLEELDHSELESEELAEFLTGDYQRILVTAHRRENFGEGLVEICESLLRVVQENPKVKILFPVHPNPAVREKVFEALVGKERIVLAEPLSYPGLCRAMQGSALILTDSGGIQEEAPSLAKPVLVMREKTERQEGVEAGCSILVGCSGEKISKEINRLLRDETAYNRMASVDNPYGDGQASSRIVNKLLSSC